MQGYVHRVGVLGLLGLCTASGSLSAQDITLRLHGSNTVGGALAPALVEAWAAERGYGPLETMIQAAEERSLIGRDGEGRRIRVDIHSHGSSTGFADLLAGQAELWMSSRPVRRDEVDRARALGRLDHPDQEHVVALDGLAMVVAPGNPVNELDLAQVQGLFSGRITDWAQLGGRPGEVRLYARDDKSGTFDTFQTLVLGEARLRADARRFESNAELTRAVAMDTQAIGFTGLAAVGSAKPLAVHAEQTQPLLPSSTVVATEDYLLARRLYFYHAKEPSALLRSLIEFALSEPGQRIVERVGYVPLRIEAVTESARPGVPTEYAELISGAQRLTLNFRFGSGLSLLDSKAERDIARLVAFMREPANAERELVIAGFADSSEGTPFFSLSLSNDRVDYVAERLGKAGLNPRGAIGFGGAVPVAPNSSELGRLKNRRVEVWLR
jgi:phosphate transport system substrate-binding protein